MPSWLLPITEALLSAGIIAWALAVIRRPRLSLSYRESDSEVPLKRSLPISAVSTILTTPPSIARAAMGRVIYVTVSNVGSRQASGVTVRLVAINGVGDTNYAWKGSLTLPWKGTYDVAPVDVANTAGNDIRADLCAVATDTPNVLEPQAMGAPRDIPRIGPGVYDFTARATGTYPTGIGEITIRVKHDGTWENLAVIGAWPKTEGRLKLW